MPGFLQPAESLLRHPVYLAVNRRSVAGAMATGLAIGMLPIPGHAFLAFGAALLLRVNLAVAVLIIWVANPLTYAPLIYAEYRLGTMLMGIPAQAWPSDWSFSGMMATLADRWQPLLFGGTVLALIAGGLGYLATDRLWRWSVLRQQRRRSERRVS